MERVSRFLKRARLGLNKADKWLTKVDRKLTLAVRRTKKENMFAVIVILSVVAIAEGMMVLSLYLNQPSEQNAIVVIPQTIPSPCESEKQNNIRLSTVVCLPAKGSLDMGRDALSDIGVAQKMLSDRQAGFCLGRKKVREKGKAHHEFKFIDKYNVLLAVQRIFDQKIVTVLVPSQGLGAVRGFSIIKGIPNGIGTEFDVNCPEGYLVLAAKRVISWGKGFQEVVYTPYTRELDNPQIRRSGLEYLEGKLQAAQNELESLGVKSHAFPREQLADVVPVDVALCLALIEHIDPAEFLKRNKAKDLVSKALVIIGTNRDLAYRYSVSSAGARGLFQFIPGTYAGLKKYYPDARLLENFIDGMNNHFNAAKASLLLFDSDLSSLEKEHRAFLKKSPIAMGKFLAAAYNGGAKRVAEAIAADGEKWETSPILREETRTYLQKFTEVWRLLHEQ
jgi:hypothetical protein